MEFRARAWERLFISSVPSQAVHLLITLIPCPVAPDHQSTLFSWFFGLKIADFSLVARGKSCIQPCSRCNFTCASANWIRYCRWSSRGGRRGRQRGGARELHSTPRAMLATSTAVINDIVATKEPLRNVKALSSKWPANYIPDSNEPSRFPAVQIFLSFFYE